MKVKLIDVAKASGVSVSTVSRVINGDRERTASDQTREKIWQVVKELGFVPNKKTKNPIKGHALVKEKLGRIGCIYTSNFDLNNDPFFSCIGLGIQKELSLKNYEIAYSVYGAMMDETELYSYILKHKADGVIVLGRFSNSIIDMLKNHFEHIVYAGVHPVGHDIDEVICDGFEGASIALNHLKNMGHEDIGYVGYVDELEDDSVIERRYEAYLHFMKQENKSLEERLIINTRLKTTDAYKHMKTYLSENKQLPTAFYCANDATAFGVMKALQESDYKIPEDVAIIGFDNVEMSAFVTPRLSTVNIPRRELGSKAVQLLIEQIETNRDYAIKVTLPFELVIRESSDYYAYE